jgi:hypothetical protein
MTVDVVLYTPLAIPTAFPRRTTSVPRLTFDACNLLPPISLHAIVEPDEAYLKLQSLPYNPAVQLTTISIILA